MADAKNAPSREAFETSADILGDGRMQIMWQLQIYGHGDFVTQRMEVVGNWCKGWGEKRMNWLETYS